MKIRSVEIRLLELPLREPFAAAHGTVTTRELVVVRVSTDLGEGWGECSALPEPTYTTEFAGGAYLLLVEELAPRLVGLDLAPDQVITSLSTVPGNPMAKAALEMAMLDALLRHQDRSLASFLGAVADRIQAGATVGLALPADVVASVTALAEEGYHRVKVKIVPEHDRVVVDQVVLRFPDMEVQVDGNGSFGAEHAATLMAVADAGVAAIEQPFPPGQLGLASALVARSEVPVVADEAAVSLTAVDQLRRASALSGVSIKPPRLGGLMAARAIHDHCLEHGVPASVGGMLESGLGRHALAALAALPGFGLTGDVSPARRWLAADPWPDLVMEDGRIVVPTGPGVAGDPDPLTLDRHTLEKATVGGPHPG
jgi:O-succinylbenzoate synthase